MPVLLELINQPDPADLADLEKIYADYPTGPAASIADWLFDQRQSGKSLVAGRFNGRLLAALWLRREGDGAAIEHLCVRAITRRRGTARQLLTLLPKQARQFRPTWPRVAGGEELAPLWQELGFERTDEGWRWQP